MTLCDGIGVIIAVGIYVYMTLSTIIIFMIKIIIELIHVLGSAPLVGLSVPRVTSTVRAPRY